MSDNVNLAIVVIGLLLAVTGVALAWTGEFQDSLGLFGTGIAAIAGLAGNKPKLGG